MIDSGDETRSTWAFVGHQEDLPQWCTQVICRPQWAHHDSLGKGMQLIFTVHGVLNEVLLQVNLLNPLPRAPYRAAREGVYAEKTPAASVLNSIKFWQLVEINNA
mmetsp:Transcript_928/g.1562  ORF Transcript_928/g.1562 Transcript_928/m.1562 type:complete len:105 (-) Transcript_928:141-455(-)